ncbi:reverse transcriptase domain, reverse transcriptase zinc-binding domain protein [Tanacetum coccineum]
MLTRWHELRAKQWFGSKVKICMKLGLLRPELPIQSEPELATAEAHGWVWSSLLVLGFLGNGMDIRFWVDRWVDNQRLCDRFPRLYHFDMRKEVNVLERGVWVDNSWVWEWDSVRDIRGKVSKELEDLLVHGQRTFKVKELSDNGDQETLWNKLVPKKVNRFIWRALRGRLPVRVELDKRGVDLDPVLCPSCNNVVETCAHCLITCDLAMSV